MNDELFRALKRHAANEGVTLRAVVEAALRRYIEPAISRRRYKLQWHTERGKLLPGVVIEDRNVLFEVMDDVR